MQIGSLFAVYFVVWWLCFIVVVPIGSRSQAEDGVEMVRGSDPGAPAVLRMWPKLLTTTLLAIIMTGLLFWGLSNPILKEYWS